jgi:hypothetical protein
MLIVTGSSQTYVFAVGETSAMLWVRASPAARKMQGTRAGPVRERR